jgi:hypothetical protein
MEQMSDCGGWGGGGTVVSQSVCSRVVGIPPRTLQDKLVTPTAHWSVLLWRIKGGGGGGGGGLSLADTATSEIVAISGLGTAAPFQ